MALPYEYQPSGNTVSPRGGASYDPMSPITSPFRLPTDYPSPSPTPYPTDPISPGGVAPGAGDFGGFDSFQPMAFGYAGGGGGEFRPDVAFGGMSQDPRMRPRLGMPRQPFSRGGFVQPRQTASPMLLSQRFGSPGAGGRGGFMSPGLAPSPGVSGLGGTMSPGGRTAMPGAGGRGGFLAPGGGNQSDDPTHTYLTNTPAGPMPLIYDLIRYGFLGPGAGQGSDYGGIFGVNPPSEIMGGVRQRAVQDAGAQERAARLGLQSRGDVDPSTYGFQALQSQLQGQQGVQNALGQADLGLRQQQLQQYWQLLNSLLGGHFGIQQSKNQQPSGLGQALGGIGGILGGIK